MARPTTEPPAVRLLLITVALAFLALFLVAPLIAGLPAGPGERRLGLPGRHPGAGRPLGAAAHAPDRGDRGARQPPLRPRRLLGHRPLRLPGPEPPAHAHRPALRHLPGDLGDGLHPPLRAAGLAGPVARRPRPEGRLRRARDRPRHRLRHLPLRGARAHPGDAGAGARRGGSGRRARRVGVAGVLAGHAAQREVGAPLRRHPLQRPRDGGVRGGVRRLRPHPRPHQHAAPARRDPLQRVPVPGRLRRRLAPGPPRHRHPRGEEPRRVAGAARSAERWPSTGERTHEHRGSRRHARPSARSPR